MTRKVKQTNGMENVTIRFKQNNGKERVYTRVLGVSPSQEQAERDNHDRTASS